MKTTCVHKTIVLTSAIITSLQCHARISSFELSLKKAEDLCLSQSDQLKSARLSYESAEYHARSQSSYLWPRLSLDAAYQYNSHVPSMSLTLPAALGGSKTIDLGDHKNYSYGPTLSYTLWDNFSARSSHQASIMQAEARGEDEKETQLQLKFSLRSSYLKLQLALEELRLLSHSLALSQDQNKDIQTNSRVGSASKLDLVISQRQLINYELQFEQKQSEVSSDFKDLLSLTHISAPQTTSRLGPPGIPKIEIELHLDSLEETLISQEQHKTNFSSASHPTLRGLELSAQASDFLAQTQKASYFPTLQVAASAKQIYPDQSNLKTIEQNSFFVNFSWPIFEGFRTQNLVSEYRKQSEALQLSKEQARQNLERDFSKTQLLLESLKEQQKLASQDVEKSAEVAKLYYQSYKGGRLNLVDVESANNRALLAKVNAARINAQILSQIYSLEYMSGEEISHEQ